MAEEKKPGLLARAWGAVVNRVTREPRNPEASRVPWTPRTTAGVHVDEDSMLTLSASWAAVRYISQATATGPWHVMRELQQGGSVIAKTHPVEKIIYTRTSPEYSSRQFRETLTHWALRYGNGYAEIEPDQIGRPIAMHPIHPDRVDVCRATVDSFDVYGDTVKAGELFYEVTDGEFGRTVLSSRRIFHIRGLGDGPIGMSVAQYAAQSIGWAKAAQIFGAAFFGNGANPSLVVKNKTAMTPEALALQRAEFDSMYRGPYRAHRTAHIDVGTEIETLTNNMVDSQFVELNQHLIEDVARWFGVPLHKIGHLLRATNNNIEHQAIEAVQDSVLPWVLRFEEEADYKLFGLNRLGFFTKINLGGLLRGDQKAQAEALRTYREMGAITVDEVRERIDMNPIGPEKGGDKHTMNGTYVTLESVGEDKETMTPDPSLTPDGTESDEEDVAAMMRFRSGVH